MPPDTHLEFGWLPEAKSYSFSGGTIVPLDDLAARVEAVRSCDRISGGWLYPPLERRHRSLTSKGPPPELYAGTFSLPTTHRLTLDGPPNVHDEMLPLFVTVFGLMKGLRLLPEDWLHLMRTAVKPGKLVDFRCDAEAICEVLELTFGFWNRNSDREIRDGFFGALHWHLLGQSYESPFESFMAQYMVLDACWFVHSRINLPNSRINLPKKAPSHAERVVEMAATYSLHLPEWAQTNSNRKSELSELRNQLVHEAKWAGQPIGFRYVPATEEIDYELGLLNTRLLLAMLGWRNQYVSSSIQMGVEHNVRGAKNT
jgi:hypothetical protein